LIDLVAPTGVVTNCKPSSKEGQPSGSDVPAIASSNFPFLPVPTFLIPSVFSPTVPSSSMAAASNSNSDVNLKSLTRHDEEMNMSVANMSASGLQSLRSGSQSPAPPNTVTPSMSTNLYEWVEGYEGLNFSIRHKLVVSVARSWYESTVSTVKTFRLYKVLRPTLQQLQEPGTTFFDKRALFRLLLKCVIASDLDSSGLRG
jgi:hypothetical protein